MAKHLITTLDCQRCISEFFEKFQHPWETSGREWVKLNNFKEGKMQIWEFKHIDHDIVVRVRESGGILSIDNHRTTDYSEFAEDLMRRSKLTFENFNAAMYAATSGSGYEVMFALGTTSDDAIVSHLKPALYALFQDVPISKAYKNNAQGLWIQDLPIEEINHRLEILGLGENQSFIRMVDPNNIPRRSLSPSTYNPPEAQWLSKVIALSNEQRVYKQQIEEQKRLRQERLEALRQQSNNTNTNATTTTASVPPTTPSPLNRTKRNAPPVSSNVATRSWKDAKNGITTQAETPQEGRSISAPIVPKNTKVKIPEGSTSHNDQSGFYYKRGSTATSNYNPKPVWPTKGSRQAMDYINYYVSQPEIPAFELRRIQEILPTLELLEYTLVQGSMMLSAHMQEPAVRMVWDNEAKRREELKIESIPIAKVDSIDIEGLF